MRFCRINDDSIAFRTVVRADRERVRVSPPPVDSDRIVRSEIRLFFLIHVLVEIFWAVRIYK